jgi:hypothetical protein
MLGLNKNNFYVFYDKLSLLALFKQASRLQVYLTKDVSVLMFLVLVLLISY